MSTIRFPSPAPHTFGKGSRRHLDPTLVAGVDLEIVPVGRVETQQAQPLQANISFIHSLVLFPSSPTPLNPQRVPSCVKLTYIFWKILRVRKHAFRTRKRKIQVRKVRNHGIGQGKKQVYIKSYYFLFINFHLCTLLLYNNAFKACDNHFSPLRWSFRLPSSVLNHIRDVNRHISSSVPNRYVFWTWYDSTLNVHLLVLTAI